MPLDTAQDLLSRDRLAEGEKDVPSVQGGERDEVEAAEVEGDIGPQAEEVGSRSGGDGIRRDTVDGNDAAGRSSSPPG